MGGTVTVASRPGATTFTLELPAERRTCGRRLAARLIRAARFHVETALRRGAGRAERRPATVAPVRPRVFAIAVVAAILGAGAALALGSLTGLTDGGTTTVVVRAHPHGRRRAGRGRAGARQRLRPGGDLRPAGTRCRHALRRSRRRRAVAGLGLRGRRQGNDPHERPRRHERRRCGRRYRARRRASSTSSSGTAIACRPGSSAGTCSATSRSSGSTPAPTRSRRCRSETPSAWSSAHRWRRSAAPSTSRARSRSASSRRPIARSTRSRPATASRTRSRSTRRSTGATRAARSSTRGGA